jgi:hypothetical protein
VIEFVGEMLTQDQAQKYGQIYDEIKRRLVAYAHVNSSCFITTGYTKQVLLKQLFI